jgi:hypothetical protein
VTLLLSKDGRDSKRQPFGKLGFFIGKDVLSMRRKGGTKQAEKYISQFKNYRSFF